MPALLIYRLPLDAGPIGQWTTDLPRIAALGFDHLALPAIYETAIESDPHAALDHWRLAPRYRDRYEQAGFGPLAELTAAADGQGFHVIMTLSLVSMASGARIVAENPDWFEPAAEGRAAFAWNGPARPALIRYFSDVFRHYAELGVFEYYFPAAHRLAPEVWRELLGAARREVPKLGVIGDNLTTPPETGLALGQAGFNFVLDSVAWWNGRDPWFLDQYEQYRPVIRTVGFATPTDPAGDYPSEAAAVRDRYLLAAALSFGVLLPGGLETGAEAFIKAVNAAKTRIPALETVGPIRRLSSTGEAVTLLARRDKAERDLVLIAVNTDATTAQEIALDTILAETEGFDADIRDLTPGLDGGTEDGLLPERLTLAPGEVRLFHARPVEETIFPGRDLPHHEGLPPRIVVERVLPELDGGRFPIKRIVGDTVEVSADIFRDGHDKIRAALWLRQEGETEWRLSPMRFVDNDRWSGRLTLDRVGRAQYTIESWTDHFASWRDEVTKKRAAKVPVELEVIEGQRLVEAAAQRADGQLKAKLQSVLDHAQAATDIDARAGLLLSQQVAHLMALAPDKGDRVFLDRTLDIQVDREGARFSAWYEMFPRSQGTEENKPGTFQDCIRRLPEVKALGFDVVYLVPIHPIGKTNRKGRDNSLTAGPGDPGSPYAIGAEAGGHTAVDPELGTLADFRLFQRAVRDHGMEVALDFAVQCSPDHPWLKEHPGWFRRRPDGTIKFAENPPKKYEDIVNVDFDQKDWRGLWEALRDAVLFWVDEGVKIFRVDNPHTKPVVFWQWLIEEVQKHDPNVLFLAEAFTRPKMMKRLGKVGFTYSYTYFTWRNTKSELTEYLTELTRTEMRDYYRPHFFPNTPDILPLYLQTSGRAGFRARLALAATLGGVYGIYNGYELCEAEAVPKKEEYLHSEKYQYKVWDWDRPGNIKGEIARLNEFRRKSPALRLFENLDFHWASHESVLFYSKMTPAPAGSGPADIVLVIVNLDPHNLVRTEIALPLDRMGLSWQATIETEDALSGERRRWTGSNHWIVLDPETNPAIILRVTPLAP